MRLLAGLKPAAGAGDEEGFDGFGMAGFVDFEAHAPGGFGDEEERVEMGAHANFVAGNLIGSTAGVFGVGGWGGSGAFPF